MKDKSILMTPANREAIVEGRKTMTRRGQGLDVINAEPNRWRLASFTEGVARFIDKKDGTVVIVKAPYAKGQRLYIKEPHYRYGCWRRKEKTKTGRDGWEFVALPEHEDKVTFDDPTDYPLRGMSLDYGWYKRSPLFMPKKFARTWLLVTDVKAPERVQEISDRDALAEGCGTEDDMGGQLKGRVRIINARHDFRLLWNSIHGEGSWDKNEWVWPIEFKNIDKE